MIRFSNDRIKKIGILLFFVFFLYVSGSVSDASRADDGKTLISLQQQHDIRWTKITFQQGGIVDHNQSEAEWQKMKGKVERVFQLEMDLLSANGGGQDVIRYEGEKTISSNSQLRIAWIGQKEEEQESKPRSFHAFLIAEMSTESLDNWESSYKYFASKIRELGLDPQINVSIDGAVNRIMTEEQMNIFLQGMFASLDGTVKESMVDNTVVSLSGYSPQLARRIITAKGKINLQTMAFVDEQDKVTRVTIGTPIIATDH